MTASAYIHNDETYMKVAASNIKIKIHYQFSKQQILGVSGEILRGNDKTNLILNNV